MSFEAAVHAQAVELDKLALEMCAQAGAGHPSTSTSLGHIVTVLMFHTMRHAPDYPDYPTADRLVLSEGHAVPIVYAAAAKLGIAVGKDPENRRPLTVDDLKTLRAADSVLDGHPNPVEGFPFFDAATGSLGQGLSVAAGLGLAARLDDNDRRVYCIVGDGESREGQIAEALDFIIDHGINNVLPIFNCNGYGQTDKVSRQQSPEVLAGKLRACGFDVVTIDGHNPGQIREAFEKFAEVSNKAGATPMAVIAKTVKGWGSPTLQGGGWHGKPASGDQLVKALAELNETRNGLISTLTSTDRFTVPVPKDAPERQIRIGELPAFSQAMKAMDMESVLHTGRLSTRRAYGIALKALGQVNDRVVTLDADVSNSTFAELFNKDAKLRQRFFECKIAEQNMVSAAVGLSAAGKIPFLSTFAKFVTRAYDQIEMGIIGGANLKIVGSHAGASLASDGPSQMSLPDIAWFRSLATARDHRGNPLCYILQPADAYAAYALTGVMAEYEGACYMRTLRPDVEFIYNDDVVFNLGGFEVLNEGRDVLICASGYMVHEANKALEGLDRAGVSATLVDLYSIPFDAEKLLDLANANNGLIVTIEDNYGASIGSAVADALVESGEGFKLEQMFIQRIPKSARTPDDILKMTNLTAADIVSRCLRLLQVTSA
ncbi:MAG: transketolase [Phycisphaerales bacterium]|nr:transketolase [Phycisphaerales bacterium]